MRDEGGDPPSSLIPPPYLLDELTHFYYYLPTMFAVIKTGGKQYIVREGQVLKIEKLDLEPGGKVDFEVLLKAEDDGTKVDVGAPLLTSKVQATVAAHGKGKKLEIIKYKPKSRYRRHTGHRQPFTSVKIEKIA
jgi:large subunit ribosomal protein L21